MVTPSSAVTVMVVPFPADYSVVVVDSGEQAKKSEGARETFNARIRDYETAFAEVKRHYPELPLAYFRDIAFLPEKDPISEISSLKFAMSDAPNALANTPLLSPTSPPRTKR